MAVLQFISCPAISSGQGWKTGVVAGINLLGAIEAVVTVIRSSFFIGYALVFFTVSELLVLSLVHMLRDVVLFFRCRKVINSFCCSIYS